MRREELTEKLATFESKQAVGDWVWHGWRVWPFVRTRLALEFHVARARRGKPGLGARLRGSLAWRRQRLRRFAGEKLLRGVQRASDVVFLTAANRSQRLGHAFYNSVVDPWAETLAGSGLRVGVWDIGDPCWPAHVGHASIQRALDIERRASAATPPTEAPPWFEMLASWAADALEAEVAWPDLARDLRMMDRGAGLFERWLRRAGPRALVLDCWYGPEAMGAALAAHRLGIAVIDLQHGLQGRGHPAYAGWSPAPAGGYEVFPDRFWVWGEWDAESLVASNPGVIGRENVSVVGNPWLSAWAQGTDRRHARCIGRAARLVAGKRAILVTLQDGVSYRDTLLPLIREAPSDWLWLVRLHRRMALDPRPLEAQLSRETGRSIDVTQATRLPLPALVRVCSWHVTGFSTCALEALAFGVPTLLTHASGAHAFAEFVAQRAMWPHRSAQKSARLLAGGAELAEVCRRASRRVFAAPMDASDLVGGSGT